MSKIRDLFKKFTKNKEKPQDSEEQFFEDIDGEELGEETVVLHEDELSEELESGTPPQFDRLDNNGTQEINVTELHASEEEQEEQEEEDEDGYEEFDENEDEEDLTDTETETINLSESSITLKDKVDHFKIRIKDQFRSMRTKDFNKSFKNPSHTDTQFGFEDLKTKALNIKWANIPTEFFKKTRRNEFHRYFQIAIIFLIVFSTAKLIGKLVTGSTDYKSLSKRSLLILDDSNQFSKKQMASLKSANVFRTDKVSTKVEPGKKSRVLNPNEICQTATKKSSASVKLINTVVLQDSVKSIASVQIRSNNKLQSIREGETVLGKIKIDKIERLKIIVKNLTTGECESIESTQFKKTSDSSKSVSVLSPGASKKYSKKLKKIKGIESDGTNFNIEKAFLNKKLENISDLLKQARGIQINNPDGTVSFKIVDIEPGGIFSYLGLEGGDIISGINGKPIQEVNEVMNLFGRISKISKLNLTIKRQGEERTQNYSMK